MIPVTITGLGWARPEHCISNRFFESLGIDTSAEWIEQRTGIRNRFSVLSETNIGKLRNKESTLAQIRADNAVLSLAAFAEQAWKNLCEQKEVAAQDHLVISGTSVPDFDIPANASTIAAHLKIPTASAFDVNSACSSFVTDLMVARSLLQNGTFERALLFNVERYSLRLDYADRRSSILFGDGAAVTQLATGSGVTGLKVLDIQLESDPSGHQQVVIPDDGYFWQNGAAVQKFAITKTVLATQSILAKNNLSVADISYFIGHQANLRMLQSACTKLGVSPEQHLFNVDEHGNQGGAGAPTVLAQNQYRYKVGDLIVVTVVGSGLTWGSVLLEMQ